jgi:hypothetical protein
LRARVDSFYDLNLTVDSFYVQSSNN